ncbi:olfactory receptor receptor, partial [Danaus plexippus plexippus]
MAKMFGKFGLEYCDLPTMMWNVEVLLRTLTIRSNRRFDKRLDPMLEPPNYEIATAMIVLSIIFALKFIVYITPFVLEIIGYLESEMLALSVELTNIWEDSKKFYEYYILQHESGGECE